MLGAYTMKVKNPYAIGARHKFGTRVWTVVEGVFPMRNVVVFAHFYTGGRFVAVPVQHATLDDADALAVVTEILEEQAQAVEQMMIGDDQQHRN